MKTRHIITIILLIAAIISIGVGIGANLYHPPMGSTFTNFDMVGTFQIIYPPCVAPIGGQSSNQCNLQYQLLASNGNTYQLLFIQLMTYPTQSIPLPYQGQQVEVFGILSYNTLASVCVGTSCQPIAQVTVSKWQSTGSTLTADTTAAMITLSLPTGSSGTTVTCYLDGCLPIACPTWGCGTIVTTTISSYQSTTNAGQTFQGFVKILNGVYFLNSTVRYHLIFPGSMSFLPVDGEKIVVNAVLVTPSGLGSVWAPGGDLQVSSWSDAGFSLVGLGLLNLNSSQLAFSIGALLTVLGVVVEVLSMRKKRRRK
ncbi:MAG: hypothetical protein ABSF09_07935 [Candidatus Bathyarchaeia archaeon]